MTRRDDREPGPPPRVVCAVGWQYRAIFEGGATQPAAGVPAARFPARWGGAGMHRRPNGVPSAAAALGAPNAAGLLPRAARSARLSTAKVTRTGLWKMHVLVPWTNQDIRARNP